MTMVKDGAESLLSPRCGSNMPLVSHHAYQPFSTSAWVHERSAGTWSSDKGMSATVGCEYV
jgi:hypothetical protein